MRAATHLILFPTFYKEKQEENFEINFVLGQRNARAIAPKAILDWNKAFASGWSIVTKKQFRRYLHGISATCEACHMLKQNANFAIAD